MGKKRKKITPKKKPVIPLPEPVPTPTVDEMARHLKEIVYSLETYIKHKCECFVCGESDSTRDESEEDYARWLYQQGWRCVDSEKFQTIGVACPQCVKLPDAERGEWPAL